MMRNINQNSFFIEKDGKLIINPKALIVPEFSFLWERDRSIKKFKAVKEFSYVYMMADFDSEYNAYGLSKDEQVAHDVFGNKKYKPDQYVKAAIEKYELLQETPSMRYLKAIRNRVNQSIGYLDNFTIKETKEKQPNFTNINSATNSMQNMEKILESLEKWEKKIYNEEEEMRIRGGGMLNVFENPEDAEWNRRR